jgi:hypothetical protein
MLRIITIMLQYRIVRPVTVAERSKACTLFARSEAGIMGSNPTEGTDVWCLRAGTDLATS